MLRLNLKREPEWLELIEGVRVKVAPITSATVAIAQRDASLAEVPVEDVEVPFGIALAKIAIVGWEGIGDEAGADLTVTPEAVEALLSLPPVWRAWKEKVLVPVFVLDAEKNGFAASPSGNTGGAENTAGPAKASARSARAQ